MADAAAAAEADVVGGTERVAALLLLRFEAEVVEDASSWCGCDTDDVGRGFVKGETKEGDVLRLVLLPLVLLPHVVAAVALVVTVSPTETEEGGR